MKLCTAIPEQKIQFNQISISCISRQAAPVEVDLPKNLLGWLNRILAEETRCMIRYRNNYFSTLSHPKGIASIFLIHSNEKLAHVDAIASRITQLGGTPDLSFKGPSIYDYRNPSADGSLAKLVEEDLIACRKSIDSYRTLMRHLAATDFATSNMVKNILFADERRATELLIWLTDIVGKLRPDLQSHAALVAVESKKVS